MNVKSRPITSPAGKWRKVSRQAAKDRSLVPLTRPATAAALQQKEWLNPKQLADLAVTDLGIGSTVVEVAIGLVFVYLLLSLICSAAKEGIEALMKKRAINLERGLREMLNDPNGEGLVKQLYDHQLVNGLFTSTFDKQKGGSFWTTLPSYIPANHFALALLDVISPSPSLVVASAAAAGGSTAGGAVAAPTAASTPAGAAGPPCRRRSRVG